MTGRFSLAVIILLLAVGLLAGCQGMAPPRVYCLGNFERARDLKGWQASADVKLEKVSERATKGRAALRITMPAQSDPLVSTSLKKQSRDWTAYEWLKLDLFNTTADRKVLKLLVEDEAGKVVSALTGLRPGMNALAVPLDLFTFLDLKHLKTLKLSIVAPGENSTFHLDHVRLEQLSASQARSDAASPVASGAEEGRADISKGNITLDFSALGNVSSKEGFRANAYVPLVGTDQVDVIRRRTLDQKRTKLTFGASLFSQCDAGSEVVISAFFVSQDGWHFNTRTIAYHPRKDMEIVYTPFDLGY